MVIDLSVDLNAFEREIEAARLTLENIATEEMTALLVEATDIARATKSRGFENVTGALRSSIGGNVFRGGFAVSDTFTEVTGTNKEGEPLLGGTTGVTTGRAYALEQVTREGESAPTLQLVLVAGMPYASYLQNLRGRDVMESGSLFLTSKANTLGARIVQRLDQETDKRK